MSAAEIVIDASTNAVVISCFFILFLYFNPMTDYFAKGIQTVISALPLFPHA